MVGEERNDYLRTTSTSDLTIIRDTSHWVASAFEERIPRVVGICVGKDKGWGEAFKSAKRIM
jgi:hypothetical protein